MKMLRGSLGVFAGSLTQSSSIGDDAGGEGAGVEAGVEPSISDASSAPPSGGMSSGIGHTTFKHSPKFLPHLPKTGL